MPKKIEVDKDELYQYYIVENHSREETTRYFGCSLNVLKNRLKEYGFKKIGIEINKEDLYQYYILENHNQEETAKYFGCSVTTIQRRLKEYGLKKIKIDKEELYQYYIVENHSQEETAKYFSCSTSPIQRQLKEYGFKKTKEQIIETQRATYMRNSGYEYPMQNPEVRNKARATNMLNLGYEYAMQNPKTQSKARKTSMRNWGYNNPMQSPYVQERSRMTNMEKRGVEHHLQKLGAREGMIVDCQKLGIILDGNEITYHLTEKFVKNQGTKKTVKEVAKFRRTGYYSALCFIKNHPDIEECIEYYSLVSEPEKEIRSFIKEKYDGEVIYNDRKILNGKEIDMLLPDLKLGIEFNGLYHHRTMRDPKNTPHKDKYYHQNKALAALEKGYRLIMIDDEEWRDNREKIECLLLEILTGDIFLSNVEFKIEDKELYLDLRYHSPDPILSFFGQNDYKFLGYTEPDYYYTDGKKKYCRKDFDLPKALATAFTLEGDDEWKYAENKGYYRYYNCGYARYRLR